MFQQILKVIEKFFGKVPIMFLNRAHFYSVPNVGKR